MPKDATTNRPVVLIIRDGWGRNPHSEHDSFNAIKLANTPIDDHLSRRWPQTLIKTSGKDVGLPVGTMGNSEVGHQNIGAGRIVNQEIMRITSAIDDGGFFENRAFAAAFDRARITGGAVHLMGLVSDGQVHSDLDHLFALIDLTVKKQWQADRLFIHAFTDGRDTGPMTGLGFIEQVESKLKATGVGRIATIIGRYYAMDRDHRWDRIAAAYQALTNNSVEQENHQQGLPLRIYTAREAIENYYKPPSEPSRIGDEFILPTQIVDADSNQPIGSIKPGDSVIFFNFRGDRPREITKAFMLDDDEWNKVKNSGFNRGKRIDNLFYCTMTGYEKDLPVNAIAFEKPSKMPSILGRVIADSGMTQFRCAETEKFPHVTFFFNDYREEPFEGESRFLAPSPTDVTTYDQKPEMSADAICAGVLDRLAANNCESLIVVNFANGDMVGHTGNLDAAIKAVEVVDACVGQIVAATLERGGGLIITADHGNAEQMWNPVHDCPHTAHTTYDVPLLIVSEACRDLTLRNGGRLADIAPTALHMLGIPQPAAMTGRSLLPGVVSSL